MNISNQEFVDDKRFYLRLKYWENRSREYDKIYRKLHAAYSGIDDSLFINNSRGFELTGKGDDYDSNGDPIYSIEKAWRTTEEGKRLIYLYEYEQKKLERITDMDHKMTDIYIETDFSILDRCNRQFLDWLFKQK